LVLGEENPKKVLKTIRAACHVLAFFQGFFHQTLTFVSYNGNGGWNHFGWPSHGVRGGVKAFPLKQQVQYHSIKLVGGGQI
jgi:hypothetical protein